MGLGSSGQKGKGAWSAWLTPAGDRLPVAAGAGGAALLYVTSMGVVCPC